MPEAQEYPQKEPGGNGRHVKNMADPFRLERTLLGVAQGYMEIAERVVNNELGTSEAKEATRALNGVPSVVKAQLEAIRIFEKGSQKAKEEAARILGIAPPAISDQSQSK